MPVKNLILIGPSSSGKTTITELLSNKYNGTRISLDGINSDGRPYNSLVSFKNMKKFAKEEIGYVIRKIMINEVILAEKNNKKWFIDDVDPYIISLLTEKLYKSAVVVYLIPSIKLLVKNIIKRNKEAHNVSNERTVYNSLKQLSYFLKFDNTKSDNTNIVITISNKDIIDACEYDKMLYSNDNKKLWEEKTNEILQLYNFKSLKSKTLIKNNFIPYYKGINIIIDEHVNIEQLFNSIEKIISN